MFAIAIAVTMAVLDAAVANIALPAIARQLGVSPAGSVWVMVAVGRAVVGGLASLSRLSARGAASV